NALRYQDFEWYEALKDNKLKKEALKNKAILEGIVEDEDNESSNKDKKRCELFDDHEQPICNITRFKMIKYSFGQEEEYVAVKENEHDDSTSTSKDACRTYQEIFCMMDKGWTKMVIVMEETYPELTLSEFNYVIKIINGMKNEALWNKAIMEGLINDDESSNDCWKRCKSYEIHYHNYDDEEYENVTHDQEHEFCSIETHKVPVCQIKRYKMIKYSFNDEEEYVAIK
nr:hypothetical protein [Tanacetum cinerariifolium]